MALQSKVEQSIEVVLLNKDNQGIKLVPQNKPDQGNEAVLQNKDLGVKEVLQNKDDWGVELELQNREDQGVKVVLQNKEDQGIEMIKQNKDYQDVEVVLQNMEELGVEVVIQNKDNEGTETVLQCDVPFTEDIGDLSLGSDFTEAKDTTAIIFDWTNPHFEVRVSPLKLQTKQDLETECQVTKESLTKTILLGQVEDKFLATVCGDLLVLWDQHAVHERIRLERLVSQAVEEGQDGRTAVKTAPCHPALTVSLPLCEVPAVLESLLLLERWGLKLVPTSAFSVSVTHIPQTFLQLDLVRQLELCQSLLGELAHAVLHNLTLPQLPHTLLQHIASQACRGAVMFGQCLSQEDCLQLLCDLVQCQAPFQCAHGRPSLAPIVRISNVEQIEGTEKKLNFKKLVT